MSAIVQIRALNPTYCYECKHFEAGSIYAPPPRARCWNKANVVSGAPVSAELERASYDPFDCGHDARFFQQKEPEKVWPLRKFFDWRKP